MVAEGWEGRMIDGNAKARGGAGEAEMGRAESGRSVLSRLVARRLSVASITGSSRTPHACSTARLWNKTFSALCQCRRAGGRAGVAAHFRPPSVHRIPACRSPLSDTIQYSSDTLLGPLPADTVKGGRTKKKMNSPPLWRPHTCRGPKFQRPAEAKRVFTVGALQHGCFTRGMSMSMYMNRHDGSEMKATMIQQLWR